VCKQTNKRTTHPRANKHTSKQTTKLTSKGGKCGPQARKQTKQPNGGKEQPNPHHEETNKQTNKPTGGPQTCARKQNKRPKRQPNKQVKAPTSGQPSTCTEPSWRTFPVPRVSTQSTPADLPGIKARVKSVPRMEIGTDQGQPSKGHGTRVRAYRKPVQEGGGRCLQMIRAWATADADHGNRGNGRMAVRGGLTG
jgi:hypothetical protein